MLKLSEVLGVPVGWFFKGLELNTAMPTDIVAILANPQIAELVRGFQAIEDENVRFGLLEMIHTINQPKTTRAPAMLPTANRA